MSISVYFLGGAIFFLYYGIKYKKQNENYIEFSFIYSALFFAFSIFEYFDYIYGKLLVVFILLLLLMIKIFRRKKRIL